MHEDIARMLRGIEFEEKEQMQRYRLDQQHSLKSLKAEGVALHPLIIIRRNFGYADYPEVGFKLAFPPEANLFRDGAAIECFRVGEEPIKGVLLQLDGKQGEFRLFAPDFPDWIEEDGVGIKLAPDTRTTTILKKVLNELEQNKFLFNRFEQLHGLKTVAAAPASKAVSVSFVNKRLNESQQAAVQAILQKGDTTIIHGPPGTGKTTTLVEAILQLIQQGEKVLVSAPSNTAVDHIAKGLLGYKVNLLRVGNASKADEAIFAHTPEGRLANSKQQKEIRQLKQRAEEFRRMALKYKRGFGKAEREQRQLLFKEVKSLRTEIKKLQAYNEAKLIEEAQVIAGTPIGINDAGFGRDSFTTLVLDEAGQCMEPLAWCIFPLAEKVVLAGDPFQLPPTVLSQEAVREGLPVSILEMAIRHINPVYLLNTQYRMKPVMAGFSSQYFYKSALLSAPHLQNTGTPLVFIDMAGSGLPEMQGPDGSSLQNPGELDLIMKLLETENIDPATTAFISPYSGQVAAAKECLPKAMRISTIDGFQGQEKGRIILSLVRSNDEGEIGFLKDYRRMNVALTRAREQIWIVGDSATLGSDAFYREFLTYIEEQGVYRSVWEFEL